MIASISQPLILCPTKRFARGLQEAHALTQQAQGRQTFAPLDLQTLEQWLSSQIEQAYLSNKIAKPPHRLSLFEERYVWQKVIQEDLKKTGAPALFDLVGLANNCMEANRYAVAWQLDYADQSLSYESQTFLRWQADFYQRCEALHALESVRFFDWQLAQLASDAFLLPDEILFAGFDQAAPQELRLRECLKAKGCSVAEWSVSEQTADTVQHCQLIDEKQTLQALMAWVLAQREENPDIRLAIVVPQLQTQRQLITDLLDSGLQPETFIADHAEHARDYNVSLGEPLSHQPLIQLAIDLLRLLFSHEFEQQELSAILLSPFWSASITEADSRAILEARLREWQPNRLTWHQVQNVVEKLSERITLDQTALHLSQALALVKALPRWQSALDWSASFAQILTAINWPGERVESSHEFQAREAWQHCLQAFARLDLLDERFNASQALGLLSQLAQEQVFQPETVGTPTIQVLGIMEALSQPVDAMWVMGMNDNQWPLPARPNPLIPAAVQRAARVANADDAVQMAFAQAIHQRLLRSAKTIVFSSCLQEGEKALRASPLMQAIPIASESLPLWQPMHRQLSEQDSQSWEWLVDEQGPAVADGEHVKGGTGLIQAQAICPAWAFYQYRLGARALKTPKQGFDAADRGELVHDALEHFWGQSCTPRHYSDLARFSEEALEQAIEVAIAQSIEDFQAKQGDHYSPTLWALESERMQRLLKDWLVFELERAVDFKLVACEAEYQTQIEGIEVTLKIDRVHALPEGGLEIVDYKTGAKPSYDSWGTTRITNPQLPIYASYFETEQTIASVQFGMVKTQAHAFVGVAETDFEVEAEKRKPKFTQDFDSWTALTLHWRQSIDAIAAEIKAGEASVTVENEDDLRYCEVLPLLRLQERVLQFEHALANAERNA